MKKEQKNTIATEIIHQATGTGEGGMPPDTTRETITIQPLMIGILLMKDILKNGTFVMKTEEIIQKEVSRIGIERETLAMVEDHTERKSMDTKEITIAKEGDIIQTESNGIIHQNMASRRWEMNVMTITHQNLSEETIQRM
jgi:hypothetical protein